MNFRHIFTCPSGWFLENPKRTGYLVFLCLFSVTFFVFSLVYKVNEEDQKREMSSLLNSIRINIEQTLKNSHTMALTLAMTVDSNGAPRHFDSIARRLIVNNRAIDMVGLVPDGIVKHVYPLEGNEAVVNYDVLKNDRIHEETEQSIKLNTMYFAGPMELKQGGIGIVGRLPIRINNKFWGFSSVVIKLNTLLKSSGIHNIDTSKYYFQFSKVHPITKKEEFFLAHQKDFSDKLNESAYFSTGSWKIYLLTKEPNSILLALVPYFTLSLLSCLLIALLVSIILKRPSELEILAKKQSLKLLRSEAKYKTIFNQAAVGIAKINFITDEYVEVNEQYSRLLGYTREELANINFKSLTHPADLPKTIDLLRKLVTRQADRITLEKRFLHKNGDIVWACVTVSPLWIEGELPKTVISVVEDITAKKKTEEIIKKSEEQYKTLFNDSPIALWEEDLSDVKNYLSELGLMNINRDAVIAHLKEHPEVIDHCISLIKILNVNKECLILHNAKSKEELIANFPDIIRHGSFDAMINIVIGVTQQEKKGKIEGKINFPNGKTKDISLTWNVVKEYEDTLERIIVSTEDITQRKASQKVILESQLRIESLINTIDGIVWECDAQNFMFTFISKKVEEILGYTAKEWISSRTFWTDHIHPDDLEWAIAHSAGQTINKKQHDFEYRMIAKDGRIVWLRDIVNVIKDKDGKTTLRGIMIDITASKDTEMELNDSLSLVTEQNRRLLNFSYIISHNLRSHTSNLLSISNLLRNADSEEEREELLPLLGSVSDALNETMHNLNEIVNIQTNVNLNVEPLDLRKYIQKVTLDLSKEIKQKDITIDCHVKKDTHVVYNPAYLENILLNCISNAIRYSDPEKDSHVNISSYVENNKTVLEIADNGLGIDLKKNKDKIFGMYKTFHNHPGAKGMGLFITKNQIDAMGGKITIESIPNIGTKLKIYFK